MTDLTRWRPAPPAHIEIRGRVQRMSGTWLEQQQMRAELKEMRNRGEIGQAWGWRASRKENYVIVYVDRLRDPAPAWRFRLVAGIVAAGALVGVGTMLWQTRWIWLTLLGIAAVAALLAHVGGSSGCHCPLCGMRLH